MPFRSLVAGFLMTTNLAKPGTTSGGNHTAARTGPNYAQRRIVHHRPRQPRHRAIPPPPTRGGPCCQPRPGVPGIATAVRNRDEISERARPAIAVFDADESADERAEQRGHGGRAPNIVEMTPEVLILLGAAPETVGSALNALRANTAPELRPT
jgi:hypothetical protein